MFSKVILLATASYVSAQCGPDLLVDDFSKAQSKFFDNAMRQINPLGGDYGTDGKTTFTIDTNAKTLTVIPQANDYVFFFAKFDEGACFDLTKYRSFQFDLQAPVGAKGKFTLTQKLANCTDRDEGGDSVYTDLSNYYKSDGTKQTVTMSFSDFEMNGRNPPGKFDMLHLKDWTFVEMSPLGQPFVFSNMVLKGGPWGCDKPAGVPTVTVAPKEKAVKSGASSILPSLIIGVAAGLAPLAAFFLI